MNPAIVATVILLLCSPSSARIAKPSPRSKPRIQHNGAQPMFKAGQHEIGPDGLVQYGLVRIPANDSNAHGCSTSHICKLEYEGKFEEAFAEYERIMMKCGDGPWTTFAALGRGETAAVVLRKSPCGSFVAMKMPAILSAAKHNAADCAILRRLSTSLHNPTCQGCFPRYFYYSNITGVCYNEYTPSIPMSRFMKAYRDVDLSPDENLAVVKEAFRQSLHAVAILRDNGIIHKDLLFKNMLVRLRPGENPWFRVVIMDFCWSESKHDPEAYKTFTLLPLGHFTRPGDWLTDGWDDFYAIACAFADSIYHNQLGKLDKFRSYCLLEQERPRTDTKSLEYLFWRMTRANRTNRLSHVPTIQQLLDGVTHV